MDASEAVEFVGVQAVLVAAGLHLVWGVQRAVVYLQAGLLTDLRPFLFVLSGLAVVGGIVHLYYGEPGGRGRRRLYWFFLAVLALYLAGYVAWHVGGHPTLSVRGGVSVHHHGGSPLSNVVDHLATDAFALANAVVELVGIVAFGWLLVGDEGSSDRGNR